MNKIKTVILGLAGLLASLVLFATAYAQYQYNNGMNGGMDQYDQGQNSPNQYSQDQSNQDQYGQDQNGQDQYGQDNQDFSQSQMMPDFPIPDSTIIVVPLKSQNNSNEAGVAVLSDINGTQTKVELRLKNTPMNVSQPTHIHSGSCSNLGDVKYPLNSLMNGQSDTTINAPLRQLMNQLPLVINVHKSESEQNVYYACGDFLMQAKTGTPNPGTNMNRNKNSNDNYYR